MLSSFLTELYPTMRKLDLRTEMDSRGLEQPPHVCSLIGSDLKLNPSPAEPRYTLSLQTV